MENKNVIFNQAAIGYSLKLPALRDVNLRLHTSAIYGLFGENGSGKTTLLNTITGGIPPMAGSLTVNGFEMPCRARGCYQNFSMFRNIPAQPLSHPQQWPNATARSIRYSPMSNLPTT